jgi:hippurate hydrolase
MMHRFPAPALCFRALRHGLPACLGQGRSCRRARGDRCQFAKDWPDLQALYQDIHSHPETAFRETRTADVLARQLKAMGVDVTTGVGKTASSG